MGYTPQVIDLRTPKNNGTFRKQNQRPSRPQRDRAPHEEAARKQTNAPRERGEGTLKLPEVTRSAAPSQAPVAEGVTFDDLGLIEPLRQAVAAAGYTHPTPIQAQAIPGLLAGRDVVGIAQTGTGKTAAFTLPVLQHLAEHPGRRTSKRPRALVLTPTRELAIQIGESFVVYGGKLPLKHTVIFGGVGQRPQVNKMMAGVDCLVATPGRLLDLMGQGYIDLSRVEFFVLDEADRMLDMGFIHDVKRVLQKLPRDRQTLLFSATMPNAIVQLAKSMTHDHLRVEVTPASSTVERITQSVMFVSKQDKRELLAEVFSDPSVTRALVFSRTKRGANRIAQFLDHIGVEAAPIHGNKSQTARQRALKAFQDGHVRALVATDIAARGIDVDQVTHVINFDLPNEPESYVHRIGRTARAGHEGIALSFCMRDELDYLRDIQRLIKQPVPVVTEHPFHAGHIQTAFLNGERGSVKQGGGRGQQRGGGGGRGGSRRSGGGGGGGSSRGPRRGGRRGGGRR